MKRSANETNAKHRKSVRLRSAKRRKKRINAEKMRKTLLSLTTTDEST